MMSKIILAIVAVILAGAIFVYFNSEQSTRTFRKIAAPPTKAPDVSAPKTAKRRAPAAANGTARRASPATVDEILETMASGNIAFNAPETITVADTAQIQLLLSLAHSVAELSRRIEAAGRVEGASIRVANRMEARLTGSGFQITAVTPEVQAISATETTRWAWDVKPTTTGSQRLHLTLSAILNVDGASTPRAIRTFDKIIQVDVTWPQRAERFVRENWQWLWAAILVPIAGWVWNRRRRRDDR